MDALPARAGPRYERNGSTRPTWDRPVAWAGLDKVPPNRTAELVALQRRVAEIEAQLATTNERLHEEIDQLRSLYEGGRVLAAEGAAPASASITAQQETVETTRQALARLHGEQRAVARALVTPLPPDPVHAHLRHRELPDQDVLRPKHMDAAPVVDDLGLRPPARCGRARLLRLGQELPVVGRRRRGRRRSGGRDSRPVLPFLATLAVSLLLIAVSRLVVTNFRLGTAIVLVVAALALLLSNFAGYLRRR
jgi:hypothetical protein